MIHRDRNHPSIIMWSIGNEIREQWRQDGALVARQLSAIVHAEDPTRPTTAGFNSLSNAMKNKLTDEVDVVGLNYHPAYYKEVLEQHPDWVIYGSETASTVSSRGIYHLPFEKYDTHESKQVTSYDIIGPTWAYPPDIEFHYHAENPRILGEFIWTGFDYLGEPTPYGGRDNKTTGYWNRDWPAHSSYFAPIDMAGFPKDRFYLYQSQWTDTPMVHLLPHWNWSGREGQTIPVMAYTTGDMVELFLNGKSQGKRTKGIDLVPLPVDYWGAKEKVFNSPYRLAWDVPYEPGVLKAIAYKGGKVIAETEIRTAGKPAQLKLHADRTIISADGQDLSFVTVRVEDADGNLCPLADNRVQFSVSGAGVLAAVDSGNPISLEPFQDDNRKAFSGMALAVIRSQDTPGQIKLVAESDKLQGDTVIISSQANTKQ
jgi:beta-galactosidase